jgi:hypothetical protein
MLSPQQRDRLPQTEWDTWPRVARDEAALCAMRQGPYVRQEWLKWTRERKRSTRGFDPKFQVAYRDATNPEVPQEILEWRAWELLQVWLGDIDARLALQTEGVLHVLRYVQAAPDAVLFGQTPKSMKGQRT